MHSRFIVAAIAAAGLGAAVLWWQRPRTPAKPNVVLITIDTLRTDRVGAYGAASVRTPTLDRLASEGVRFDAAYATAPLTLPSHVSMLSGRLPVEHTVRTNDGYRVPDTVPLVAESLQRAGYRTAAIVGSVVLRSGTGLARGFERYDDNLDGPERGACDVVARAGEWLNSVGAAPFFLWIHVYDPHLPYGPPEPFASEYAGRLYDGEVAYVDRCLGTLLERAGLLERSAVIVAADHGEGLGDHGERSHGALLYDTTVRVPLIVRAPGGAASPGVSSDPVSVAQVGPTVLSFAGVTHDATQPGLLVEPHPQEPVTVETLYLAQQLGWSPLYAARIGRLKVISSPASELYDVAGDPGEQKNLAPSDESTVVRLRDRLHRELSAASRRAAKPAASSADPDAARQLAALGYVSGGGGVVDGVVPVGEVDPRSRLEVWQLVEHALELAQSGQLTRASEAFNAALQLDPGNVLALKFLGAAALERGDFQLAIAYNEGVAASGLHVADALANLALAYYRAGRLDDAVGAGRRAVKTDAGHSAARANLALALQAAGARLAREGNAPAAVGMLQEAAALEPSSIDISERLAAALHRSGRNEEARTRFEAIVAAQPGRQAPHLSLAILDLEGGRAREAAARLERIKTGWPGAYQARFYLGEAYRAIGDKASARTEYAACLASAPPGDPIVAATKRALESLK